MVGVLEVIDAVPIYKKIATGYVEKVNRKTFVTCYEFEYRTDYIIKRNINVLDYECQLKLQCGVTIETFKEGKILKHKVLDYPKWTKKELDEHRKEAKRIFSKLNII